jgi:hypothetical protein
MTGTLNSTTNGSGGTNFTPSVRNTSASPSDTTRLTPLQQGELLRIGGRLSETLPSLPLSPVQAGEALRISDTATSAEMAALQRDNFAAYVEKLRPTLAPQDRENPFAYSLGADVPIEVKRQVYAEYLSGLNAPGAEIGSMAGANASFDESRGPNGMISINGALLGNTDPARKGQFEAFSVWGHLEEVGHWGDMRAQQIMGRAGGDSLGDEGARFAMMALPGVTAGGTPQNGFIGSYDIRLSNGTTQTVQFDTVVLKALAAEKLASGSFARENRIGNVEHFGPEGHYQTTYITASGSAAGIGLNAAESDSIANQMALGSQLPDMLEHYNAASQFAKCGDINNINTPCTPAEIEHLTAVYRGLHNLPLDENNATLEWVSTEREKTTEFIREAIKKGNFLSAGIAIHKLGDSYSHTDIVTGLPFPLPIGHGRQTTAANIGLGSGDPDDMYTNPSREQNTRDYQGALSAVVTDGLIQWQESLGQKFPDGTREIAINNATKIWLDIFDNNVNQAGFHQQATGVIANLNANSDSGFKPLTDDQMGVQSGASEFDEYGNNLEDVMNSLK